MGRPSMTLSSNTCSPPGRWNLSDANGSGDGQPRRSPREEPEDGVIRVCGLSDDNDISIMAFTDDGVEELKNLLEMHRENSQPLK